MSKKEQIKRYLVFLIGLWVSSMGISFATKAELGVSPISGVPYVLSVALPLSMGTFTFITNLLFVAGQIAILKSDFNKMQLIQIPMLLVFGYFIDLSYSMFSAITLTSYGQKVLFMLAGCVTLALGVSLQVTANVVILSGEALIKAIADKFHREFGSLKVCFDTTMVIMTCITSFVILHRLEGIREGTVIAALSVGWIVRIFNRKLAGLNEHFLKEKPIGCEEIPEASE